MRRLSHACLVALFSASRLGAQTWTPPMGVPTPPFGINEVAGPNRVYVNPQTGNDGNPGTAASPRASIPNPMTPGMVVSVTGGFGDLTNPNGLTGACTAAQPCFLEGGVYGSVEFTGSYLIVEHAQFYSGAVLGGSNHLVIRDNEFVGDATGGGLWIETDQTSAPVNNIVFLRNTIHDAGTLHATTDQDVHCIGVGYVADHVWILDNFGYRCSGDGVQVNGGGLPSWQSLNHIYIGRNTFTNNRQSGAWAKDSADVVMSENNVSNMWPNSGGPGVCLGTQYGSARLVIIGNRCTQVPYALDLTSSSSGFGQGVLVAGNVLDGIVHMDPNGNDVNNTWSDGVAIFSVSDGPHQFLHNTIAGVLGGIQLAAGGGPVAGTNNIIVGATRAYLAIESEGNPTLDLQHTLWDVAPLVFVSGNLGVLPPATLTAEGDLVGAPGFVNASGGDFTLSASSPGKAKATPNVLDAAYQAMSGTTYLAVHGVSLPVLGPTPDMGGFGPLVTPHPIVEPTGGALSAPTNLRIVRP